MIRRPKSPEYRYKCFLYPDQIDELIWSQPEARSFRHAFFYEGTAGQVEQLRRAEGKFAYLRDVFGVPKDEWDCAYIRHAVGNLKAIVIYADTDVGPTVAKLLGYVNLLEYTHRIRPLIRVKWQGEKGPFLRHSPKLEVPLWVLSDTNRGISGASGVQFPTGTPYQRYRVPQVYRLTGLVLPT